MKDSISARLSDWPDAALSVALVALAFVLVLIAARPGHHIQKAIALAWVLLP